MKIKNFGNIDFRPGISILSFFLFIAILISCCGNSQKEKRVESTKEIKNFAYIPVLNNTGKADENGISILNRWLKENPDKKICSFSGVLAYRDWVSGYVVYFVQGNNSKQKFEQISYTAIERNSRATTFGISALQWWIDALPDSKIVAFCTIPAYSGGVREYIICYE